MDGVKLGEFIKGKHSAVEAHNEEVGGLVHSGTCDPAVILLAQVPEGRGKIQLQ